jgi:hypothetical protein
VHAFVYDCNHNWCWRYLERDIKHQSIILITLSWPGFITKSFLFVDWSLFVLFFITLYKMINEKYIFCASYYTFKDLWIFFIRLMSEVKFEWILKQFKVFGTCIYSVYWYLLYVKDRRRYQIIVVKLLLKFM